MERKSWFLRVALSVVTVLALAASAGVQKVPDAPAYEPKFAYAPTPDPSDTTKAGATVAVVEANWTKDASPAVSSDAELKRFRAALGSGIGELLGAKKLTVKGPFPDVAEMTYAEKKSTQLAVTTELQVELVCDAKAVGFEMRSGSEVWNDFLIDAGTTGAAMVKVIEPQSKEVLWQKRIEFDKVTNVKKVRSKGTECHGGLAAWPVENRNAAMQGLEKQYAMVLQKLDAQLSRAELAELAKQAEEIKAKKVY